VTTAEAARVLGVEAGYVSELIGRGVLTAWKVPQERGGGRPRWEILDSSVFAEEERRTRRPPCPACGRALGAERGPWAVYCTERCRVRANQNRRVGRAVASPPPARRPRWTEALILAAIRRWADLWGEAPTAAEWRGHPPAATAYRCEGPRWWPTPFPVQARFGSWSAAIEAAGVPPRGRAPRRPRR
jgi:excisionase family DNA binding protein